MNADERAAAVVKWFWEAGHHAYYDELLEPISDAIREAEQAARSAALEWAADSIELGSKAEVGIFGTKFWREWYVGIAKGLRAAATDTADETK